MADETEIKKPTNMLEALEQASKRTEDSLVKTFSTTKATTPEMSLGSQIRMYHHAVIRTFKSADILTMFQPTLGLIAKCLLPNLTEEEKEVLRNDKLSDLL